MEDCHFTNDMSPPVLPCGRASALVGCRLAGQGLQAATAGATVSAVAHVVAGAAHAVGGVVFTNIRHAHGAGLARGTGEPSTARLLGVRERGAGAVEQLGALLTVVAGRAGFRETGLACSACWIRASRDTCPNQFLAEQIDVVQDTGSP